jgi:hypothetical protein
MIILAVETQQCMLCILLMYQQYKSAECCTTCFYGKFMLLQTMDIRRTSCSVQLDFLNIFAWSPQHEISWKPIQGELCWYMQMGRHDKANGHFTQQFNALNKTVSLFNLITKSWPYFLSVTIHYNRGLILSYHWHFVLSCEGWRVILNWAPV